MRARSQYEVRIDTRMHVIHLPSELRQVVGDAPFLVLENDQIIRAMDIKDQVSGRTRPRQPATCLLWS